MKVVIQIFLWLIHVKFKYMLKSILWFFSAPGHEKIWTKIPGQQDHNEFFYEEKKLKSH